MNGTSYEKLSIERLNKERGERRNALASKIQSIRKEREALLNSYCTVRIARLLASTLPFVSLAIPLVLVFVLSGQHLFFIVVGACILFGYVLAKTEDWRKSAEEKALRHSGDKATSLDKRESTAEDAEERLNHWYKAEYDRICSNWSTYPPDWEDRRRRVLSRDNHCCTQCGWPRGYKRRARKLHVHHKVAISDGGKHSLSNLTTLCHICHRKVDKRHRGVTKVPFTRKRT